MIEHTILFLSWRDIKSPKSGGAETHAIGLMKCFAKCGYQVIHFSPKYEGLKDREIIDGIVFIRKGGVLSVIFHAFLFYMKNRKNISYVVDQCNTHRFFTPFWVKKDKRIFYIHQLTREIWGVNSVFPFSVIGRLVEEFMLRVQSGDMAITVSESTRKDLIGCGFDGNRVFIIPNAIPNSLLSREFAELINIESADFIYVGRYSKYKGIDAAIEAIGILRETKPFAKLHIVGKKDEKIICEVIEPAASKYGFSYGDDPDCDVVLHGFVSEDMKYRLMECSRALLFPSMREGWGIIVTEAAALGTPSIVYNSPGCRDAVDFGNAGYLCKENTSRELARLMLCCIDDKIEYNDKRHEAYSFAQGFTWDRNLERVRHFFI